MYQHKNVEYTKLTVFTQRSRAAYVLMNNTFLAAVFLATDGV